MTPPEQNEHEPSRLETLFDWLNEHSGGVVGVIRDAFQRFSQARGAEAAASLAYYTMFSLFPLLLALIAGGSFFLEGEQVKQEVIQSVSEVIPISQDLIESNVQQVLKQRGTVGIVGVIGLLWSGMGVFTVLVRHLNRAWENAKPRNLLERRLVALGIVGLLVVLLILSLLSTPILDFLPDLQGEVSLYETTLWGILSAVLPAVFSFVIFLILYRWVPNTRVSWRQAVTGAAFVAVVWELAKEGFTWYLSSGLVRYRLVYGSLGAVVALMLWVYLSSLLTLLGAHLSAAVGEKG
jgi:membrane protein